MKNISLILNAVLLVAVAVLFYLHFSAGAPADVSAAGITGDVKIAYINSDSVLKQYDYLKAEQEKFDAKGKVISAFQVAGNPILSTANESNGLILLTEAGNSLNFYNLK